MLELSRWQQLLERLGATRNGDEVFQRLLQAYSDPTRAYHNASHIADCLQQLELVRAVAESADAVEAAIWFHDVVYDPRAKDNEEQSATFAQKELEACAVAASVTAKIADLILVTKHNFVPTKPDERLLVDVDLSILGREPNIFDAYDDAIRREYDWVPVSAYIAGRTQVLEAFLKRDRIFGTKFFHDRYEVQARSNLQRAIQRLRLLV